jgi:hypothetical protein
MTSKSDLLPLKDILSPKPVKPNLVENIQEALAEPARTLRNYLFTPGIHGHFERLFQDVKEGRGGGYWVQAEYGGGKTHFLSTLLCLLGESGEETEAEVWSNVSEPELRADWEGSISARRLLGAHMSLMGTAPSFGSEHPRLIDLIDRAVSEALERHGISDSSIGAGDEIIQWFHTLEPQIRASVEGAFFEQTGLSSDAHVREYGSPATANAILKAADARTIKPDIEVEIQKHFERVLDRLKSLNFDGLVIVIDEYLSRQRSLSDEQLDADSTLLETIGYKLGRQESKPIYLVVASQSQMPAKLMERMDPMILLRDEDREYSQIVCKRIMDYRDALREQATLYHTYYSRHFRFLSKTTESETREIFPFQSAVFRFLRDLVGSSHVNLPSTRFAIGVAYDAITVPQALENKRFLTRADLLVGQLKDDLLGAAGMKESGAALRQAWDFVENSEWATPALHEMAYRVVNYLYLDAVIGNASQNVDQIIEGTLVEDERGMLLSKQIAKAILDQLNHCDQIEVKGDTAQFTSKVSEGEQFETVFQKVRKGIPRADARIEELWVRLLMAPVSATEGVPAFLSALVTPMSLSADYCGIQYAGKAMHAQGNLASKIQPLERLTQPERFRVVVVPQGLSVPVAITDPAIAIVAPGALPESLIDEIRGLLACQEIGIEYRTRPEPGADKMANSAANKARELTGNVVARQKELFREGEIYTKEGLTLNPKQLFKDSLSAGVTAIGQQLVRSAYPGAPTILNGSLAKKGALATADAAKIFDAMLGGVAEAKTKGAAEAFAPMLGLATTKDPLRIVPNAGPGPDAVANVITQQPGCTLADLYDHFCTEPYGLPNVVVDLLVLGCVFLGKPYALELRPPAGVSIATRDRRGFSGPIRANQLRQMAWPAGGLKGFGLTQSREISWNDFVPVASAIDPDAFSMTNDQREIELQEKALRDRLVQMKEHIDSARTALRGLGEATGEALDAGNSEPLDRLAGLAALATDFSREGALKYVADTWQDGDPTLVRADIAKLRSLAQLVGEAPRLAARLSWFRALTSAAPASLHSDIEMTRPLVSVTHISSGAGQLASAAQQLDHLYATFRARFREQHAIHVEWVTKQRGAIERASRRLPTLARLNKLAQLGPPAIPTAAADIERVTNSLLVCERPDAPETGSGLSCMSCRYTFGDGDGAISIGERAEEEVTKAIDGRARLLSQGLIAEAIQAAGDADLLAILTAIQAGEIKRIIDEDLLTDELVKRLASVLSKAKQQTVPSARVYDYLDGHPHITRETLDGWLNGLRGVLDESLSEAKKLNPGKEITIILKADDDEGI